MTLGLAPVPDRWGFCPSCERWRLSGAWHSDARSGEAEGPRCPVCGTPPDALEAFEGRTGTLVLHLVHTAPSHAAAAAAGRSADPGTVAPGGDGS